MKKTAHLLLRNLLESGKIVVTQGACNTLTVKIIELVSFDAAGVTNILLERTRTILPLIGI